LFLNAFIKVLENGIACSTSCSILLGSLIEICSWGFPDWDGNNLNLGIPIGSGSCLQGLENVLPVPTAAAFLQ